MFIFLFNSKVPFSKSYTGAHHYFTDPRIEGREFEFLRALGAWDAQWYLDIADEGYPRNLKALEGMRYAFFPLYPLFLALINFPVKNIEFTAFITSNALMLMNFASLYFVLGNFYGKKDALKTIFLLFLFPFSIFYRSYFTEGLFLLLLVWFAYFLIRRRWLWSAFFLSLLLVTRPNGAVLELLFLFALVKEYRHVGWRLAMGSLVISVIPFLGWLVFCWVNTGSPIYWMAVQSYWDARNFLFPYSGIFLLFTNFFRCP